MKIYCVSRKIILCLFATAILTLLWFSPSFAEDIYVAQTAAGSDTGSSCSSAHSITWLNTSGNWGIGSSKVSAGDTVHLCGTITTALTVQASGSSGLPITILFEPGAKFSKAYWASTGAIAVGSRGYITIDGGTNGIIENTNNGSAGSYTNQQSSIGIVMLGGSNVEIKNLTIQNIYVRTSDTDYTTPCSDGSQAIFYNGNGSNIRIHDNTFTYTARAMSLYFGANTSGISVYNNTHSNGNAFLWLAPTTNITIDGVNIYNNTSDLGTHWNFPSGDRWHSEYIHTHTDAGGYIHNMYVYGNTFGPYCPMKTDTGDSSTTAWIFDEAKGNNHRYYNNLFLVASGYGPTNAVLSRSSSSAGTGMKIYNNTFIKSGTRAGNAVHLNYSADATLEIKNNIAKNFTYGIYVPDGSPGVSNANQIDYNVYYGVSSWNNGVSWASWTGNGYDAHSTNGVNPLLDERYVPTSDDTVAKNKGVSLSSYFTTDKNGGSRPQDSAWDVGAFESVGTSGSLSAPAGLRFVQ